MNKFGARTPKDWLENAQVHLLWLRRKVRNRDQREWDNLTEAVIVMERCLKSLEDK